MVGVDGQEVFSIDKLYPERNDKEQIKEASSRIVHLEIKVGLKFSSSSFVTRDNVPLLNFISLACFYLSKQLFSSFLQFKSNFVRSQNNSKYRD